MTRSLTRRLTPRLALAGAVIALLLGAAFVLLVVAVGQQRDAGRLALRSQEAITAGTELEKTAINLENGLRTYVSTGRQASLGPWNSGLRVYPVQVRKLGGLVSDEPGQQAQVRGIGEQIGDYVNLWAKPLLAIARQHLAVAQNVIVTGSGRVRIDQIRASFQKLFAQERAVARSRGY